MARVFGQNKGHNGIKNADSQLPIRQQSIESTVRKAWYEKDRNSIFLTIVQLYWSQIPEDETG